MTVTPTVKEGATSSIVSLAAQFTPPDAWFDACATKVVDGELPHATLILKAWLGVCAPHRISNLPNYSMSSIIPASSLELTFPGDKFFS